MNKFSFHKNHEKIQRVKSWYMIQKPFWVVNVVLSHTFAFTISKIVIIVIHSTVRLQEFNEMNVTSGNVPYSGNPLLYLSNKCSYLHQKLLKL